MTTVHPIIIVDYDSVWPAVFEELRQRVGSALADLSFTIEHVGSTSVPGLAAKPIIDLDILLRSAADQPLAIERLSAFGYVHRGDLGIPGREAFSHPAEIPRHHLYLCPPGSVAYRDHIAFRDYLRTHPETVEEYARLKHELARIYHDDRDGYTDAKTTFITGILSRL